MSKRHKAAQSRTLSLGPRLSASKKANSDLKQKFAERLRVEKFGDEK